MKFKRSKQVKSYADVEIITPNFLERKNWADFQKFHTEKTNKFYKVFRREVNKYDLNYNHKNALLSLREKFGHVVIRSAYRSPTVNKHGNENNRNRTVTKISCGRARWTICDLMRSRVLFELVYFV